MMQEAIALKTIETMNPVLAKIITMIITLVAMYRYLKRENYEYSQSEEDYNWKWAFIGTFAIILIPNTLIESIAGAGTNYLMVRLSLPSIPVLTPILVWLSTLLVAMLFEIAIQIVIRYIKRIKYS